MNVVLDKPLWDSTLSFWFNELKPKQWFVSSTQLDQTITDRFSDALHELAAIEVHGEIDEDDLASLNISCPLDTLAAILITDQFSRNIHRGNAKAFDTDDVAYLLSNYLITTEHLAAMTPVQIQFAVMPQMHAENLQAQEICVRLFEEYDIKQGLKSAIEHRDIIEQFGRFPHRNKTLGRESSAEEILYLKDGSAFGQA